LWVTPKLENLCLPNWKSNTVPCTARQHHTIIHPMVPAVQHSFQLHLQRSHFFSLCTCNQLARIFGGNQKNTFYHHLLRWRLCYFSYSMDMLVFHACSNQKSSHTQQLIVHIKIAFIWKFYFLETPYVKVQKDYNCFDSSINSQRQTSIFLHGLLKLDTIVDKNMNFGLIHIHGGNL